MRPTVVRTLLAGCSLLPLAPWTARGQVAGDTVKSPAALAVDWRRGPATVELGAGLATLELPKGTLFTGPEGARRLLERMGNPPGAELGLVAPLEMAKSWFVLLAFEDVGHVEDGDRDRLAARPLLASLQQRAEDANALRAREGLRAVHVVRWYAEPRYDPRRHSLTWALEGSDDGGRPTVNYDVRFLGRRGTMSATLVTLAPALTAALPEAERLLAGFSFLPGNRYGDFRDGDKVAPFGLADLVAGGPGATHAAAARAVLARVVAASTRGARPILLGIIALLVALLPLLRLARGRRPGASAR
jgi:uncharacterized membrane-anchored protein